MELVDDVTVVSDDEGNTSVVCAGTIVWVVHDRSVSSTIDVLVPGYGVQSIDRVKVQSSSSTPSTVSYLEVRACTGDEGLDGLVRLLRILGRNLQRLMVSREEIAEIEAVSIESCAILQACPNLHFLKLEEIHVTDIARLADFYETHNCQVSVLEFSKLQQTNDKVADFFEVMRRSSSRMSQQIRELRIELHESVVSMDTILAVQEILIANRNLELVILIVVPGFKRLFKSAINLLPPVYLPVASSPCKCDPSWRW